MAAPSVEAMAVVEGGAAVAEGGAAAVDVVSKCLGFVGREEALGTAAVGSGAEARAGLFTGAGATGGAVG